MTNTEFLHSLSAELDSLPAWSLEEAAPSSTLILSIGMNKGFTRTGAMASPRVAAILPATRSFLKSCRDGGYFIAAVTDFHTADSIELGSYPPHCLEDSSEPELAPEIGEFPQKILTKNSTNAFFAPGMDRLLNGKETVVVTGCCTDICILQFALSLKAYANQADRPLEVIVPRQLVETYDAPGHPAGLMQSMALHTMLENGIRVVQYLPTK